MRIDRILNKLSRISNKHSVDTGFSWHGDEIACYCENLWSHLSQLQKLAKTENLTIENLLTAQKFKNEVDKTVNKMFKDKKVEKYVKKYGKLLNKALEEKDSLYSAIKANNAITTSLEVAVAEKLIENMKKEDVNAKHDYKTMEKIANLNIGSFFNYHYDGYDYDLISHMYAADKANQIIADFSSAENASDNEKLKSLKAEASALNDKISLFVIEGYDKLIEIDSKHSDDGKFIPTDLRKTISKLKEKTETTAQAEEAAQPEEESDL